MSGRLMSQFVTHNNIFYVTAAIAKTGYNMLLETCQPSCISEQLHKIYYPGSCSKPNLITCNRPVQISDCL